MDGDFVSSSATDIMTKVSSLVLALFGGSCILMELLLFAYVRGSLPPQESNPNVLFFLTFLLKYCRKFFAALLNYRKFFFAVLPHRKVAVSLFQRCHCRQTTMGIASFGSKEARAALGLL